ncbi:MAG: PAS domain S-box protein [Dissulfurispiraceae bacterium]
MIAHLFDITQYVFNATAVQMLVTALAVFCLGIFALTREKGSQRSVAFSLLTLAIGMWLFCFSWMYSSTDTQVAMWWAKAATVGIVFIPAAIYHFSGQLWGDAKFRKNAPTIWIASTIFAIIIITTDIQFGSFYHYQWGFYPKYRVTSIPFLVYFFGVMIEVVRHNWSVYRRSAKGSIQQIQAKSVLIAFSIGYFASFDYFAAFGIPLYPFGYVPMFLFLLISGRAIVRYRLLAITPALAAHQIIETMHDALIVMDREGVIKLINKATCSLLGYSEHDLTGMRPTTSMINDISFAMLLESFVEGGMVQDYEVDYHTQENTPRILSLSTSILRDDMGEPQAIVCVMRDITEHRLADEGLKQSLSLQLATLESTADGILVVNSAGTITAFNARFMEMWRLQKDVLTSLKDTQALSFAMDQLKEPKAFLNNMKQLYDHPGMESFDELEFKDGRVFECYSKPQRIGDQPVGRVWSFRDVTERKQAEEVLVKNARLLRRAEEVAGFGNWEFLMDENKVRASEGARAIYGLGSEEWSISEIRAIALPQYQSPLEKALRDLIERGIHYNIEFKICRPTDGKIIDINSIAEYDASNKIVFGVLQDITARKRAEVALQESKEKVSQILNSTAEGIYGIDMLGNCTFCNPSSIGILGYYTEKDLIGKEMHDLIHHTKADGTPYPKEECDSYRVIATGEFTHTDRDILWRSDGTSFPAEVWTHPIFKDNELMGAVVTFIDISKRVVLEVQLLQAQKMEAVGTLSGGIAHDFNNILSAILGYADLLHMKMSADDPNIKNIEEILGSVERAAQLTHSLLAFSRNQLMTVKTVDLVALISKLKQMLARIIGEDIEFRTEFRQDSMSIMADSGQIEQVIMNLATNARDAMPKGGTLTIVTDLAEVDEATCEAHDCEMPGKYVVITVSDTGMGISREIQKRIFDPFFTTKDTGKGTGLGLSMAYGIIRQHKGFINVDSEQGNGTTFRIYLPAIPAVADDKAEPTSAQSVDKGTETILMAEDDPALRELSKIMLESFGYKVILAEDGQDAVSKFADHHEEIGLVILDMMMPKMTGMEAYEAISDMRPTVKAFFLSGYTADKVSETGLIADGMEIVMKPISPRDLLRTVRRVLDSSP